MQKRDRPYAQFNFLVTLGEGSDPKAVEAGFQEVTALGMEVGVAEYRYGNFKGNFTQKVTGLGKSADVTLKRGVMGSDTVYNWFKAIRDGKNETRTVRIDLLNEESTGPVQTWILQKARVVKFTTGPLNAKSNEIAVEELTLNFEVMEME
jgi:phage tail-like protein